MEWLIGLAIAGFAFAGVFVMPWVNRGRINDLERDLKHLRARCKALTQFLESSGMQLPESAKIVDPVWPWQQTQQAAPTTQPTPATTTPAAPVPEHKAADVSQPAIKTKPVEEKPRLSFEQQFGARLPVWIGGIALALAGFFLVKYSIEIGLLSPIVRVILGGLFGLGLLAAAEKFRAMPNIANHTRIAQALSGAGIADLYVVLFAATSLYGLLPSWLGFIGMAGVTATAVLLSLRHGKPIALLGLFGGVLTPALIHSTTPDAALLFLYLYAVMAGLMIVIRERGWWAVSVPVMLGGFAWASIWLLDNNQLSSYDSLWLGLFLLATTATYVLTAPKLDDEKAPSFAVVKAMRYCSLIGAGVMMAWVTGASDFSLLSWGLFFLLTIGSIALAYGDQARYGFAPWVAMGINLLMLAGWSGYEPAIFALIATGFAAAFIFSGYRLQAYSERPLLWSGLVTAATLAYYLVGYAKLLHTPAEALPGVMALPYFWGALALIIAGFSVLTVRQLMQDIPNDYEQKRHVLSVYAAQATAFVTIGLTIELEREFLSVAVALQVLALAWINTKVSIERLRQIAAIVCIVFGVLLIPQILLLVQLTAYSLVEAQLRLQETIPIVAWPIFQLGLPALAFLMASYLFRSEKDDAIVRALEVAAIALVGVMGYYLTRHAFHVAADVLFVKAGFFERGVITNILFAYGLLCLFLGQRFDRYMVTLSGLVLAGVALFRLAYFDLIAYNPYWATQSVGELPILNALLLTYGLSLVWMARLHHDLLVLKHLQPAQWLGGFMLLVGFTLVSLEVRQLFHGAVLNDASASNAEIYSYSVAWLLFGVALLIAGTWRGDKMLRVASLIVMLLTVGKVFLYDASELEGLFRVFSFLGLGVSLLGLSWFYTKFVFGNRRIGAGSQ